MSSQPFFRNLFTDMTAAIPNAQHYDKCGEMELRTMECFEAYGQHKGLTVCNALYEDFKECFTTQKQRKRFLAMRAERQRQWLTGKRSNEEHYAPAPRVDSY